MRRAIFPILMLLICMGATAADWAQWRGPERDGKSSEKGLLQEWPPEGPPLLLTVDGIGRGFSSPAIAGGRIYVTGMSDEEQLDIRCYGLSGEKIWEANNGAEWFQSYPGARSMPVVDGEKLYSLSGYGRLAAFRLADGMEAWHVDFEKDFESTLPLHGYAESPLIDGERLICEPGGPGGSFAALDKHSAKLLWRSTDVTHPAQFASIYPIDFRGIRQYVGFTDRTLASVDARDGRLLWQYDRPAHSIKGSNVNLPVFEDGIVFATSGWSWTKGGGAVKLAIDGTSVTATQIYETEDMVCDKGGYVLLDGRIYGHNVNDWSCIEIETGKTLFKSKLRDNGSIIYADGLFYILFVDGTVGLVRPCPDELKLVSSFKLPNAGPETFAHPAISDGRLYLRSADKLFVYDIKAK